MSQWKLLDFECPVHGKFEVLTDKRDGEPIGEPCPEFDIEGPYRCMRESPVATTNAVNWHMKRGEVSRGKNDTALPPHILSTESLADGMPMDEWKSIQSDKANDERLKLNREMVS